MYNQCEGTLTLKVLRAKLTRDVNPIWMMDPYATVVIKGKKVLGTRVHQNGGLRPIWDQHLKLTFRVVDFEDPIKISVYDQKGENNEMVGSTSFILYEFCANQHLDEWLPIKYQGEKAGTVKIQAQWKPDKVGNQERAMAIRQQLNEDYERQYVKEQARLMAFGEIEVRQEIVNKYKNKEEIVANL